MEKILHPAATQVTANFGWLLTTYLLSFQIYFNPNGKRIGVLQNLEYSFFTTLNHLIISRNPLRTWNKKDVWRTTENNIHLMLLEIPIQ